MKLIKGRSNEQRILKKLQLKEIGSRKYEVMQASKVILNKLSKLVSFI